jgi:hypothetical protein
VLSSDQGAGPCSFAPRRSEPTNTSISLRTPARGGRQVQSVIKALGRRDQVETSGLVDGLIASAARHCQRSIVLSNFYRGELPELRRTSIGPELVFGRLWAQTGCRDVLTGLLTDRRFGCDIERAVYLTVLHRLMVSGSDRHSSVWRNGVRVPGAEQLDLDHVHKAMAAWLGEADQSGRSTTKALEKAPTAIVRCCSRPHRLHSSIPPPCGSRGPVERAWANVATPKSTYSQFLISLVENTDDSPSLTL